MNKIYLFIFTFILSFFSFSNIKAIDVDDFISVDVLPTCDSSTANNIYLLSSDNHYHKCNEIGGGFRNILVGDVIAGKTIYLRDTDTLFYSNYTPSVSCQNPSGYFSVISATQGGNCLSVIRSSFYIVNTTSSLFICPVRSSVSPTNFSQVCGVHSISPYLRFFSYSNNSFTISNVEYIVPVDLIYSVSYVDTENPYYYHLFISSDSRYEYEDLGEATEHIYFVHLNKDFYLFYDFEKISTFDIFSSYDFSSFNDFQRLVIVIGVNTFYLGFLALCIYIVLKLIYKLMSWL